MLRYETEFIVSDIHFSKWDPNGIIGITADTFQSKYVGQLNYWRINDSGQLDELQSVALPTGGVAVQESSHLPSLLFTAHTDPVLRLWDIQKLEKPIKRYHFHTMSAEDLQVSPFEPTQFVSCSRDSSVALWNIDDSEPEWATANENGYPVISAQYHPQNPSLLFTCPLDSKIELWNLEDKRKVYTITPPDDMFFASMSVNPYQEYLISVADENGRVYLWDLRKMKKPLYYWQAHGLAISQMKFNPHDERLLGTASTDSFFHLWYIEANASASVSTTTSAASMAPNSSSNSTSSDETQVKCLKSYKTHSLPITSWDWSIHELGLLADCGSDYSILLWNFIEQEQKIQDTTKLHEQFQKSSNGNPLPSKL